MAQTENGLPIATETLASSEWHNGQATLTWNGPYGERVQTIAMSGDDLVLKIQENGGRNLAVA